ncbi:MAG: SEC-C metal-binding domain-containing protein, partial [Actinomycetota bacterium]
MDPEKSQFLFGEAPEGADLDDPDVRAALLGAADPPHSPEMHDPAESEIDRRLSSEYLRTSMLLVLADQIADEQPPEVWAAAKRLLSLGIPRESVRGQLALVLMTLAAENLGEGRPFDLARYVEALDGLPLPSVGELRDAVIAVVSESQPMDEDRLSVMLSERLNRPTQDPAFVSLVERVVDDMLDDGLLAYLPGDRLVNPRELTDGIVLTHRLTETECLENILMIDIDLAPYAWHPHPYTAKGEEIESVVLDETLEAWLGPEDWLSDFSPDEVIAVSVDHTGRVMLGRPATPSGHVEQFAERLRAVYEVDIAEPQLPADMNDLVVAILAEDRSAFAQPLPPLKELCRQAGLEIRGNRVAHESQLWHNQTRLVQLTKIFHALNDAQTRSRAVRILDLADDPAASPQDLRECLETMRDPRIAFVIVDVLIPVDEPDEDEIADARQFSQTLNDAATKPKQKAVAGLISALVSERSGETLAAEAQIEAALAADPTWPPVIDRAAWCASDRGDAAKALRLWRQMGSHAPEFLHELEPFAAPEQARVGRNEPCWCGSGRKYKFCHLGSSQQASLPDRVGWLCRKTTTYLERRGGDAIDLVLSLALARVPDPDDEASVAEAAEDPIVIDTALCEGGWFEAFLEDRGPLLPDDEAL